MQERLYRSNKDKMIAGVAGGLGEYFAIDPVIVRIAFVAAVFISGIGIIAYILLWIIVPERDRVIISGTEPQFNTSEAGINAAPGNVEETKRNRGNIAGMFLIFMGLLFLADNFIPHFSFDRLWPVLLIAIGAGLLMRASNKRNINHETR